MKPRNTSHGLSGQNKVYLPFFKKVKRDHLIFFICILIASLFWLLIKLSDVYRVTYKFRVNYTQVPVDKRLTSLIDTTLNVAVTARGFALLDMGFRRENVPLSVDLQNYQLIHDKGTDYYIFTEALRKRLADKLNVEESDIVLSENRLGFVLEELASKRVPVIPRYTIGFKNQYDAYLAPRLIPDTVEVFGPVSSIDTLHYVFTKTVEFTDVEADIQLRLALENPASSVFSCKISHVLLEVDVERFTESSLSIPVNVISNIYSIKTFPSMVNVYYKVAQKDFNKVKASQFNVGVDTDGIDIHYASKLHLIADRIPANVSNIRIVPTDVEFLIVK